MKFNDMGEQIGGEESNLGESYNTSGYKGPQDIRKTPRYGVKAKQAIGVQLDDSQKQLLGKVLEEIDEDQQDYFRGKVAYALTLEGGEQETYMQTLASRYGTNLTSAKVIEENKTPSQNIDDDELREVQNTVQNILKMIKDK